MDEISRLDRDVSAIKRRMFGALLPPGLEYRFMPKPDGACIVEIHNTRTGRSLVLGEC